MLKQQLFFAILLIIVNGLFAQKKNSKPFSIAERNAEMQKRCEVIQKCGGTCEMVTVLEPQWHVELKITKSCEGPDKKIKDKMKKYVIDQFKDKNMCDVSIVNRKIDSENINAALKSIDEAGFLSDEEWTLNFPTGECATSDGCTTNDNHIFFKKSSWNAINQPRLFTHEIMHCLLKNSTRCAEVYPKELSNKAQHAIIDLFWEAHSIK